MAAAFYAAAMLMLLPGQADATLKCQEIVSQMTCSDSAPHSYEYAPGQSTMIPAPVISGFPSACWTWQRKFQCVEQDPIYTCDPTADFSYVKANCSLTAAAINSTVTISSLTFITNATYTYRCPFSDFTTSQTLPNGQECVLLNSTTTDTASAPAAPTGTAPSTGSGNPPTTTSLSTTTVTDQQKVDNYVCYYPPQTTCSDTCYQTVTDPATGKVTQTPVACTNPVSSCVVTNDQCTGALTTASDGTTVTSTNQNLGPDGRCINRQTTSLCQAGDIPRCLNKESCTLSSTTPSDIQANGVAMSQTQKYICSNQTESCAQTSTVSNCVHANAWGWDNLSIKNQVGQGLGEFNQALAKADAIQKGMNEGDPYIFSGQDRRCHYAVGSFWNTFITIAVIAATMVATGGTSAGLMSTALQSAGMTAAAANTAAISIQVGYSAVSDAVDSQAFGSDCCKNYVIEGSDGPFRFGSCSIDEVKLAVSRRKGLYHYLGTYCSKKGGFPLRECKEKTKTYCTFDDMLALTVNEQGRAQLDALASADPASTQSTPEMKASLYTTEPATPTHYIELANAHWTKLTSFNHSQIWFWQFPGYCQTQDLQTAAYNLYEADINAALSTQGIQPGTMTKDQAIAFLKQAVNLPSFQECPESPGMASFMTCSLKDDSCDVTKLPEGPTGVEIDATGTDTSTADVNWRIQQLDTFAMPGDYGVTSTMPTDATFAAVSASVNEYVTKTGSCHTDGACDFMFAVTDKTANSLGAHKRVKDYAQFPLYMSMQSAAWPTINYLSADGTLDTAARSADPNLGLGTPLTVSTQRFLFHPNSLLTAPASGIHDKVLLDWGNSPLTNNPAVDFAPILVPTSLPPATKGFYPYGDTSNNGKHFYLSGGCDPNSKWCDYTVEVDISVPRHPWGSAKHPRCWGFTIEQMAALDFNKMDLSKWIDSLNLDSAANGLTGQAAKAMTDQATKSAQSFYSAFKTGSATNNPNAGTVALVVNTNVVPMISSTEDSSYTVHMAVPANWPNWFDNAPNNNPVTNVWVNWGDGSQLQSVPKSATGRAFDLRHDYGSSPPGNYKLMVSLDTANNGTQTLSTTIRVTPDAGGAPATPQLDFNNPGTNGAAQSNYVPSNMQNGVSEAPANLETLSPGTTDQFNSQGDTVTAPK
ncbi:conjugal transfer protein TraN [Novimethylophilus kurashikiensis]|nr:conjugal transfer protein TraN [Novimethylophilus kurashikiensis]